MPTKPSKTQLAKALTEFLGADGDPDLTVAVAELQIHRDPHCPVTAVRIASAYDDEPLDFLVPDSLDIDEVEEVEFKTWPPKPDAFHRRGGTES